jgi:hypothetical protein
MAEKLPLRIILAWTLPVDSMANPATALAARIPNCVFPNIRKLLNKKLTLLSHCPPATRLANLQLRSSVNQTLSQPALANLSEKPFRRYRLLSLILMPAAGMFTTAALIVVCGKFKAFCYASWHIASIAGMFISPLQR